MYCTVSVFYGLDPNTSVLLLMTPVWNPYILNLFIYAFLRIEMLTADAGNTECLCKHEKIVIIVFDNAAFIY